MSEASQALALYGACEHQTDYQTSLAIKLTGLLGEVQSTAMQLQRAVEASHRDADTLASLGLKPITGRDIERCGTAD